MFHLLLFARLAWDALQIGNDILTLRRVGHRQKHFRSWGKFLGGLEPLIEASRGPNTLYLFQRGRIAETRHCSDPAADYSAVRRADSVGVERVATAAFCLISRFTGGGVARCTCRRSKG